MFGILWWSFGFWLSWVEFLNISKANFLTCLMAAGKEWAMKFYPFPPVCLLPDETRNRTHAERLSQTHPLTNRMGWSYLFLFQQKWTRWKNTVHSILQSVHCRFFIFFEPENVPTVGRMLFECLHLKRRPSYSWAMLKINESDNFNEICVRNLRCIWYTF